MFFFGFGLKLTFRKLPKFYSLYCIYLIHNMQCLPQTIDLTKKSFKTFANNFIYNLEVEFMFPDFYCTTIFDEHVNMKKNIETTYK